jgi:hypothetical protein
MSVGLLLDMAVTNDAGRPAVVSGHVRWTTGQLAGLAARGAGVIAAS